MNRRSERALGLALLALTACGHPAAAPAPSAAPSAPAAAATAKNRRTIYVVRAKQFVADTTAGHEASGSGAFDQPHITFVDRNGGQTVADAPKAVLTSADKSVLMTGGVTARSQDGNVLSCDRLRYDGVSERIHGDGHVMMRTPSGLTLGGDEVDGDARLRDVRVYRR
jgi:LPS export ABC transporter protein LptC